MPQYSFLENIRVNRNVLKGPMISNSGLIYNFLGYDKQTKIINTGM